MDRRDLLEDLYRRAVEAVHPARLMSEHIRRTGNWLTLAGQKIDLNLLGRMRVVSIGKGAGAMMGEVESELSDLIDGGVVVVPHGTRFRSDVCTVIGAGHPLPDEGSLDAAKAVTEAVTGLQKNDLVLVLISGGASALLGDIGDVALEDMRSLFDALLRSGADISELNTVRKHFSILKGGRLAAMAFPAQVVCLMLSDVLGDRLDLIGSGPTVGDPSTWKDTADILEKHGLRRSAAPSILDRLEAGLADDVNDTPKPGDLKLGETHNILIGSNSMALEAIAREAAWRKFHIVIDPEPLRGEARLAGDIMAYRMATYKGPRPALFICGGETTVTVMGKGKGGRSQEFVLSMICAWRRMGLRPEQMPTILAAGTDGIDGPTDAAGGFADATVYSNMQAMGLDPVAFLDNNDAYEFLRATGGLFITGATGTNVADLVIGILDAGF